MAEAGELNMIWFDDIRFEGTMAAGWIRDLESSDSRIHKEKVVEKALMASKLGSADAQAFLFNCYQAYNPFYTFNVRQVPETDGLTGRVNPWPRFWGLLEALRTRSVTGNRARENIAEISQEFDSEEWNNLARRVIIKDLRCGISEKTLNKVLGNSEWRIPIFSCQLAQDSAKRQRDMTGKKRLEVKLDGVRVLAVLQRNTCVLHSRNGKVFDNFPQIAEFISSHRSVFNYQGISSRVVLDGEIVGESFQKLMRQAHRKSDAKTDGMVFHVFDIIPLDDFQRGYWNAQQRKRTSILESIGNQLDKDAPVQIMSGVDVDLDTAEGHDIMRRFANDAVNAGYEGIMIKDINAPYECKRSNFWMKWKPTISVDLEVTNFEEGTGRNQGRLGAFVCSGVDDGRQITVNVGSGFSDEDRTDFWKNRDSIIGHLVEIQADAVTQNQDGSYSLRFPRFLRFRDFSSGAKI